MSCFEILEIDFIGIRFEIFWSDRKERMKEKKSKKERKKEKSMKERECKRKKV